MLGNQISLTNNVAKQVVSVTATQNQTDFTVQGGYRINQLGVYRNGVRLVDGRDFLARNGSSVTLISQGANAGDAMEFVVFDDFRVADALSVNTGGTVNASVNITGALQMGTGTSIFSPANNVLTLGTNSAERVRVSADGSVGINSTAPTNALDVRGDIVAGGDAALSTRPAGIALQETGVIVAARSNASLFVGFNEGTDTATSIISSTGNATFQGLTVGTGSTIFSPATNVLTLGTNSAERIRITSGGNLGISDTEPAYLLSVKDGDIASMKNASASGGNAVNMMRFRVENSSDTTQKATLGGISAETVSSWGGSLTFHTKTANGTPDDTVTERMRIDNGGDVGINTDNPTSRLHLNIGADQTWAQIHKSRAANEPMLQLIHSAGNRDAKIRFANNDGSWSVGIDGSENLVINSGETDTGGSGTTRARFTTDGLCFGSDTAAVNALDDYEEGTFTVSVESGVSSPGYSVNTGNYTKIGRLVTFNFEVRPSSSPGTTNSDTFILSGLPFDSANLSQNFGSATINYNNMLVGFTELRAGHVTTNNDRMQFYNGTGTINGNTSGVNWSSGKRLIITGLYMAT